jgi:glycosyltransferase involved in cell wall biosynthesis
MGLIVSDREPPSKINDAHGGNQPLVSIFMPVYNQESYIAAALDSILCQTYANYEIVISDDCSRDLTPIIIKQYADKFPEKILFYKLANENLGSRHFELLLKKCKGEYVCLFSGDDIMYPQKIRRQMDDVLRFGLSFHGHSVDCIDKLGIIFSEMGAPKNRFYRSNGNFIINGIPTAGCSWLVKKSHAKFDQALGFLHDFDMVIRVLGDSRLGYISNEKLGAYRVTKASWSKNLNLGDYLRAYSNLASAWIRSRMYSECLWLVLRVLLRLLRLPLKIVKMK